MDCKGRLLVPDPQKKTKEKKRRWSRITEPAMQLLEKLGLVRALGWTTNYKFHGAS